MKKLFGAILTAGVLAAFPANAQPGAGTLAVSQLDSNAVVNVRYCRTTCVRWRRVCRPHMFPHCRRICVERRRICHGRW